MASPAFPAETQLLDDKTHIKGFFTSLKQPTKTYRVGSVTTSEVQADNYVEPEIDDDDGSMGVVPAIEVTETNEVHRQDQPTSDSLAYWPPTRSETPTMDPFVEAQKIRDALTNIIKPDEKAFKAYGLVGAPITTSPANVPNGNTHITNLSNGNSDKISDDWTKATHDEILSPETKPFHPGSKLNPEAIPFEQASPGFIKGDLDGPEAKKNFFNSVRSKKNALSGVYSPGSVRNVDEAVAGETPAFEATALEQVTPKATAAKGIKSHASLTAGEPKASDHYAGNGTFTSIHLNSPHLTGIVAPPPTPESTGKMTNVINVPATIHEQMSEPLEENRFTLRNSIHAPPHMRSSFQVQRSTALPEMNASFERLSFKAAGDDAMNDGSNVMSSTNDTAKKPRDSILKVSGLSKMFPTNIRDRPTKLDTSRLSASEKTGIDVAESTEDFLSASDDKGKEPTGRFTRPRLDASQAADLASLVLGTRHAKVCPPIDIQRLMDLGIYSPSLQENVSSKEGVASMGQVVWSTGM